MTDILVLCTANVCRSVMAQSLLTRRLADLGVDASVRSAGLLRPGLPPAAEVVRELSARGIDVASHRSSRVGKDDLATADIVLTAAREHLRYAVVTLPEIWPRAFTLKELARRGHLVGPRPPGQPLGRWLALAHHGRDRSAMLGDSDEDDLADPTGGPPEAYAAMTSQLDSLSDQIARLVWGPG